MRGKCGALLASVLSGLLLVGLTACSTGSNANAGSDANAGSKASASDELSAVKDAGVIKVGIEAAYPPFNYYDKSNNLVGFDVDITQEIGKRLGVKVEYVPTPWDSIIGGLLAKKYDIIISSMAITEERKQKVDFSDPYYHTGSQLFARTNTKITDPSQIKGLKVGVAIGTTFEEKARELGAQVITYKTDLLAFDDVKNGRLDALMTDGPVGNNVIKERGYDIKAVGEPLIKAEAGMTLRKGNPEFKAEINKILKEMQSDGSYTKISDKWFGTDIR